METLRRLLKDRTVPQIPGKRVSVEAIRSQRDSIQNLLSSKKLETFGRASSGFQLVVLPCLESIQEDLSAMNTFKRIYDFNTNASKTLTRFNANISAGKVSPANLRVYGNTLATQINSSAYMVLCGSTSYVSLTKTFSKALQQCLNIIDSIDTIPSVIGDVLSLNKDKALSAMEYEQTQFVINPIYGRLTDQQQLRSLVTLISNLSYCDPVGAPSDLWNSHLSIFETSLFDHDPSISPTEVVSELDLCMVRTKRWHNGITRKTNDYVGDTFCGYLSNLMDRVVLLTHLCFAMRLLSKCLVEFTEVQLTALTELVLTKPESSDYDLILDELNRVKQKLAI